MDKETEKILRNIRQLGPADVIGEKNEVREIKQILNDIRFYLVLIAFCLIVSNCLIAVK